MRKLLLVVVVLGLVSCAPRPKDPVVAPGTPGAPTALPAGTPTIIFAKPIEQMNAAETDAEIAAIDTLLVKLGQRREQLTEHRQRLTEAAWALWLRISAGIAVVLAGILVWLAFKFAKPLFIKIALGLAVAAAAAFGASFLVHYFLAIALVLVLGVAVYGLLMLWHAGWNTKQALAQTKQQLAEAEDGVKVLAKSAGAKIDTTAALAEAEIHNSASLKALLSRVGIHS
ncbi:MAG: hypothetical protein ABFE07_29555 [Armatimonadia bacterium]